MLSCATGFAAESNYAELAPLASHSLLLAGARAGERIVVAGDRGHVLLSDDGGGSWRQARVPTRALLTGVCFSDARQGLAVGHDETILKTEDGGQTWTLVHSAPEKQQPLLDVWCADANNGLAVGAYGTILATHDAGKTWDQQTFEPAAAGKSTGGATASRYSEDEDSPADRHLNRIVRASGGALYIAAEAGYLFRSDDNGASWIALPSSYDGSFFGLLPLDGDALLAFGLRGHLFRSEDGGRNWREIQTGTVAMLTDAVRIDAQTVVIGGLQGTLLISKDGGRSFELQQQADRKGIQAVLADGPGQLITIGEAGVQRIPVPVGAP